MCESTAYLRTSGEKEELLLEDVVMVKPESGRITLTNVLGDTRRVEAEIEAIDLLNHRILLRRRENRPASMKKDAG